MQVIYIHKTLNNKIKNNADNKRNNRNHKHDTRNTKNLYMEKARTNTRLNNKALKYNKQKCVAVKYQNNLQPK